MPANAFDSRRGRYYSWKGDSYWSVTTILRNALPPMLSNWAAQQVADYAVNNSDLLFNLLKRNDPEGAKRLLVGAATARSGKSSKRGSAVHAAAEAYSRGEDVPSGDADVAPFVRQFERFVEDFDPAYHDSEIECQVFNRRHGYAGTLDAIAEIDGKRWLLDMKTADVGKTPYPDVALQLCAYRNAEFIGRDNKEIPMPQVDGTAVLHITPERYLFIPVNTDEHVFQVFRGLHFIFTRWLEGASKQVLGQPMAPKVAA